jgi:hypothetical protein
MPVEGTEALLRGSVIHVLDEDDGWVLVADNPNADFGLGWLQKPLTFTVDPSNLDYLQAEVDRLKEAGVVVSVDVERNEAVIDRYRWILDPPSVQEGRSRLLAYYVGNSKDSRRWVDIVEQQTGRRIAQFSEAKGMRVY